MPCGLPATMQRTPTKLVRYRRPTQGRQILLLMDNLLEALFGMQGRLDAAAAPGPTVCVAEECNEVQSRCNQGSRRQLVADSDTRRRPGGSLESGSVPSVLPKRTTGVEPATYGLGSRRSAS